MKLFTILPVTIAYGSPQGARLFFFFSIKLHFYKTGSHRDSFEGSERRLATKAAGKNGSFKTGK